MNPAIVGAVGASLFYSYKTGRLSNFIDNLRNKNNDSSTTTSSSSSSSQATHQESRRNQPVVIVPQSSNARNSYLVPFGVACLVGLGGYFYFIHSSGTKKVIGRVEETAEETQNLVQQTDDNNAKRFEILDKKNESRAQNLEIEIRGEQRAGFKVISEQIYCLQQVAIQTLNAVASSLNANNNQTNNNESDNITNEKLLGFCDKAQEMADTIISDQHILKIKENNLNDIKAEIQIRSNNNKDNEYDIIFNNNDITPGGPLDDDQHNNNNNNNNNNINNYNQPSQPIQPQPTYQPPVQPVQPQPNNYGNQGGVYMVNNGPQYNYQKQVQLPHFEKKVEACVEAEKRFKEAMAALRFEDVDTAIKKAEEAVGILRPHNR